MFSLNLNSDLHSISRLGLAVSAAAWTRYHVTVTVNAIRGRGPLCFGAFLDWAVQAGLLRLSDVAYQFRHRQLQDWLTSQSEDSKSITA